MGRELVNAPQFLFDVGSPNAFLVHRVLPGMVARTGVAFEYVPVLLGGIFKATGNQSPMAAYAGIPSKLAYERVEMARFVRAHGIGDFRMNPHFPLNTLQLMRGAVAARALGVFEAYVEAVFAGMWVDGLKMDDAAVVAGVLDEAGLPAEALLREAGSDVVKRDLVARTEAAVTRGVFGLPSFLVGEALFFGKERLGQVEAAALAGL